ncbi:threonine synthase [Limibacter armeniacum]|uniref:threonine synthase n=1 Tax=Limibacter armeniacum TaxID=466084 RepID=UPI002FE511F9
MKLYSTKREAPEVTLKEAVFRGLPQDNGLYMPEHIGTLPQSFFDHIEELNFQEIAFEVSKALLGDEIPEDKLKEIVDDAINFEAPVRHVHDNIYSLELFHGPTLAFKDFGARFMSRLMSYFLTEDEELHILVATSGDTGSAVAQGFLGVPGIKVTILYPSGKVSHIQEQQLTTVGQNVQAFEVEGTFDDCQRMVKEAFLDKELSQKLRLSSANSINISRLIPQSFYYFNAYAQLKRQGKDKVVFCVPSGNFGNLCGGLIAKRMGLPVIRFVAATNVNDVVPTYLNTGVFSPRPSTATISNAMDVGNPSNFPRIRELYDQSFEAETTDILGKHYTDQQTKETIHTVFDRADYIMCPHSAIGYMGIKEYLDELDDEAVAGIFLSTAHAAKFGDVVEPIIDAPVEIPERLVEIVNREKVAELIAPDFEVLKQKLLNI